jgi:hypothetical protein
MEACPLVAITLLWKFPLRLGVTVGFVVTLQLRKLMRSRRMVDTPLGGGT